jgi:hypothetical protein
MQYTVALFGEAEKGEFQKAYYCQNLAELSDCLGEPPSQECKGLHFAIQTLLFERDVLFFRVHEEGFSMQDYMKGLYLLEKEQIPELSALCLPGVGDQEIIEATAPIVETYKSCLILTERDLYDYLTYKSTI